VQVKLVNSDSTLVIGIGEVGSALADVLEQQMGPVLRLDLAPQEVSRRIAVMHVCIPFHSPDSFQRTVADYIGRFQPALTILNSTVLPGTTRALLRATGAAVAYSPVRGKHAKMTADLKHYRKFVAALDVETARAAERHFRDAGMTTQRVSRPETLELAKLAETSYFGVLIGFAQELNRYANRVDADYSEAAEFFEEVEFLPRHRYFPGFIGGHCVVPNLKLLLRLAPSALFEAVLTSNEQRADELRMAAAGTAAIGDGPRCDGNK
jgi:UDP-N-acetyl-D-mannosaminuronate dehydrogenase